MPKISAIGSKGLLISYLLKILLSTAVSLIVLTAAASLIFLKLDIALSFGRYVSVGISALSALIISFVSIMGFKNNYMLLSVISASPLAVIIFVNFLVNDGNSTIVIIKLIVVFVCAVTAALIKSAKKR